MSGPGKIEMIFGKAFEQPTCIGKISDSCEMSWSLRILKYSALFLLLSLELVKEASQASNFALSLVSASLLCSNKPPPVSKLSPALKGKLGDFFCSKFLSALN